MKTLRRSSLAIALIAILSAPVPARAAFVSGLTATVSHGQTFLTWTSPPGTGWTYTIYRSTSPDHPYGRSSYSILATVGDSTWCDRRCSTLLGTTYPFVLPDGAPLDSTRGLFVYTASASASAWYAVLCDSAPAPEDYVLRPGVNQTIAGVVETPERPQPVRQRSVTVMDITGDVYTLWTSDHDTPMFPAMCNRPSVAYDCAVIPGGSGDRHALVFSAHVRGGNFLQLNHGTGIAGEWVVTMDDYMPTAEGNTFWFGYNDAFDITATSNPTPTSGWVGDFTMRRVAFTLEWARATLPIDTTRVYVMGASMGGIGGAFLTLRRPDLIAGAMLNVPLFDFSFESDPNTACTFNVGGVQRWSCDHLFGTVEQNLPTDDGGRTFELLNGNWLVRELSRAGRDVPPIVAFSGRHDTTIGWAEKPIFYRTMHDERAGGTFFFDNRNHNASVPAAWLPMMTYDYLYQFRSDRSFPAFSNCSADGDPGDGSATSGDSVGTINGFMAWDTTVVDTKLVWSMVIRTRDLTTLWGPVPAPDSVVVDVTPRRVQNFKMLPFRPVQYWLSYVGGLTFLAGEVIPDANGVVTIPQVPVHALFGTRITLTQFLTSAGVGDIARGGVALSGLANPLRGTCNFEVTWPRAGSASVDVLDISGRRVLPVVSGSVLAGRQRARLDTAGLAPGLYIVRARQGSATASRTVAIIR